MLGVVATGVRAYVDAVDPQFTGVVQAVFTPTHGTAGAENRNAARRDGAHAFVQRWCGRVRTELERVDFGWWPEVAVAVAHSAGASWLVQPPASAPTAVSARPVHVDVVHLVAVPPPVPSAQAAYEITGTGREGRGFEGAGGGGR